MPSRYKPHDEIVKITDIDGRTYEDRWMSEDYLIAWQIGRARLGVLGVYYAAGMRRLYIPYDRIERAYIRQEPSKNYLSFGGESFDMQRVVLFGEDRELVVLEFQDERTAQTMLDALKKKHPEVKVGFRE